MYKVFINDKPLFLTSQSKLDSLKHCAIVEEYQTVALLHEWILSLEHNSAIFSLVVWHTDLAFLWKEFTSLYKIIESAGGLVKNGSNEILFIYRLGKWDLPKGKVEAGEEIKAAAIREVEEECGISEINLLDELPATYHTYHHKGKDILKKTHWFRMAYNGNSITVPQLEEGITAVEWIAPNNIQKVVDNTYASVVDVLEVGLVFTTE